MKFLSGCQALATEYLGTALPAATPLDGTGHMISSLHRCHGLTPAKSSLYTEHNVLQ